MVALHDLVRVVEFLSIDGDILLDVGDLLGKLEDCFEVGDVDLGEFLVAEDDADSLAFDSGGIGRWRCYMRSTMFSVEVRL